MTTIALPIEQAFDCDEQCLERIVHRLRKGIECTPNPRVIWLEGGRRANIDDVPETHLSASHVHRVTCILTHLHSLTLLHEIEHVYDIQFPLGEGLPSWPPGGRLGSRTRPE